MYKNTLVRLKLFKLQPICHQLIQLIIKVERTQGYIFSYNFVSILLVSFQEVKSETISLHGVRAKPALDLFLMEKS